MISWKGILRRWSAQQSHQIKRYRRWPEVLKCELQELIPKKAEGMRVLHHQCMCYCSLLACRFRWAVCQLDILKRLKPNGPTFKAALSNLPKTLYETCERVLLAIPEDGWLSVQQVFNWLMYHNDLFGTNIALGTLVQAVQQITLDPFPQYINLWYDFESLRECCGCLIMVGQEETRSEGYQRNTVAFAHYTVKEYLESPPIRQKKVGFFALGQERLRDKFAEIALRQALAITDYSKASNFDHSDPGCRFQAVLWRFFCAAAQPLARVYLFGSEFDGAQ
ncbi:L-galactose dehydrogenase [Paraphaeosphaeria sporulosa]